MQLYLLPLNTNLLCFFLSTLSMLCKVSKSQIYLRLTLMLQPRKCCLTFQYFSLTCVFPDWEVGNHQPWPFSVSHWHNSALDKQIHMPTTPHTHSLTRVCVVLRPWWRWGPCLPRYSGLSRGYCWTQWPGPSPWEHKALCVWNELLAAPTTPNMPAVRARTYGSLARIMGNVKKGEGQRAMPTMLM